MGSLAHACRGIFLSRSFRQGTFSADKMLETRRTPASSHRRNHDDLRRVVPGPVPKYPGAYGEASPPGEPLSKHAIANSSPCVLGQPSNPITEDKRTPLLELIIMPSP